MNRSNQLSLDLPEYEVEKEECYANYKGKYTVDISQIYRFYIAVNSIGTLIKTKEKIKGFDFILECDDEKIADEILDCVPKAKSRKYFKVPNFKPLLYSGIDKSSVQLWISAVERKMGFKKSIYFRVVNSRWDY
ncbi:TPA: hypothetical protein JIZ13_14465 [Acinetobacter nosocomialis]|jgi:hypothetical protein|uniref:Uncharacterized protein n=1 Tax=Acinetobacter baumannii TaxID=470 RepID=A0A7Z7AJV4_ACIBA|nr:hypothetical protein [Acinetobacter baumannii]KAE9692389.1 hypothetical protein GP721_27925 [Enterobacteriaceae bacterium TzEc077]HAV4990514.1 hypothetical protein [Acinetobacter nosocomialis]AKQ28741.1 hypothetical protein ACX60_18480 [Acinetobacter baumannii]APP30767.1 hypothetical protein AUO97_08065 [Acinetobacter baumannii]APX49236.1 hypothetical protein AT570_08060 [Acinetobacter baumannii]